MGGWFVRAHEYSVLFGDKRTRAELLQDGVIQVITPPGELFLSNNESLKNSTLLNVTMLSGKGKISVRVLSDETPIGPPLDFVYK